MVVDYQTEKRFLLDCIKATRAFIRTVNNCTKYPLIKGVCFRIIEHEQGEIKKLMEELRLLEKRHLKEKQDEK